MLGGIKKVSESEALKIAEQILISKYGVDVLKQRPCKVSETKVSWTFEGTFHCLKGSVCAGGVASISIRKSDGSIFQSHAYKISSVVVMS